MPGFIEMLGGSVITKKETSPWHTKYGYAKRADERVKIPLTIGLNTYIGGRYSKSF